jgi:hypothetical protein
MVESGFVGWLMPTGYLPDNLGVCRSCGATILWCTTPAHRKAPINADGTSHFATCPFADRHRKKPNRARR